MGKGRQHGHFKTSENVLFGYCFSTMKENGRVICFFRTFEWLKKHFHAHLLSSEDNHQAYAIAPTLAYSIHEPGDETSLVGIAAFLQELRLLIQQYFNIVHYVGWALWKHSPKMLDCVHFSGHDRPLKCPLRLLLPAFSCIASAVRTFVIARKDRLGSQWMIIKMGYKGLR